MGVADPAHYLHHVYLKRALGSLGTFSPKRILDAGCGSGDHSLYLARRFPTAQVEGVDLLGDSIRLASDSAQALGIDNVVFEKRDLTTLEVEAEYDLIISIDVLEHIPRQEFVLGQLRKALRPGGHAFFHIPTVRPKPVPLSKHLKSFHQWAAEEHIADDRTADEFVDILQRIGYTIVTKYLTFGYFTGELATSLFALPHRQSALNRIFQGVLAPPCRLIAALDPIVPSKPRYAIGVLLRSPSF